MASTVPLSVGLAVVQETTSYSTGLPGVFITETVVPQHIGAAQMDGATDVAFAGFAFAFQGAAQMDGATSVVFQSGIGTSAAHMDGFAAVAFTGQVTGGFHIGAAQMDGVADVTFEGIASVILEATAQMDGVGSMLGVATVGPLPPHAIILTAGM